MVATEPVLESQARYRVFKRESGSFEPIRDQVKQYFYPVQETAATHFGYSSLADFVEAVETYTGEPLPAALSLQNNRWTADDCCAIVFFVSESFRDFYDRRPSDPFSKSAKKEQNEYEGRSLNDLCPKGNSLHSQADTGTSAPNSKQGSVSNSSTLPIDHIRPPNALHEFCRKIENRHLVWRLARGKHNSVDKEAFGLNLEDVQPSMVGESVIVLLDITVKRSYLFPSCQFSFSSARFRANIDDPDLSFFNYTREYRDIKAISQNVYAQILGGGADTYVEFTTEAALDGHYELKGEDFLSLQPSTIEFAFDGELYAHASSIQIIATERNEELSRTKEAIIACLVSKGLGKRRRSAFVTLATHTFRIRPGSRR